MTLRDPIYVVAVDADEALALRAHPAESAEILVQLLPGQLVARLDEDERDVWWQVFADTPGEGAYVGYVDGRRLQPWTAASSAASEGP